MAIITATRGGLAPLRSLSPINSQAARAATPATASVNNQCHLGPRKTRTRTIGIRTSAVRIRFIHGRGYTARGSAVPVTEDCSVLAVHATGHRRQRSVRQFPGRRRLMARRTYVRRTWNQGRCNSACGNPNLRGIIFHFTAVFADAAVTTLAGLKVCDGLEQVNAAEVGPVALGDEDFGVGDLPEQEVGDAQLARGTDQQVGIGHVRGVEMAVDV